ncbi:MAG: hypothetical protein AAF449_00510 [Myxococcota bacterium]
MKNVLLIGSSMATVLFMATPVQAHNVWCHCPKQTGTDTLEAFLQAEKVTELKRKMLDAWYAASVTIEHGVIAEFKSKLQGTPLEPEHFQATLAGLTGVKAIADSFDAELRQFKALAGDGAEPNFSAALDAIVAQSTTTRLLKSGGRYSNVGSNSSARDAKTGAASGAESGCSGILGILVEDLQILRTLLDETIEATRDAIPLAEKGDFSKVMLSGRNRFGDKMPQLTDMFSRYDRLYVELVLNTISATMQVYPKGFQFLED